MLFFQSPSFRFFRFSVKILSFYTFVLIVVTEYDVCLFVFFLFFWYTVLYF